MDGKSLLIFAIVFIGVLNGIQGLPVNQTCGADQFRCFNLGASTCIPRRFFCDRKIYGCADNSDERFCTVTTPFPNCPVEVADWFRCRITKRCIPSEWKCDGLQDCPDGSDEIPCGLPVDQTCGSDQFPCFNGGCVQRRYFCDGDNGCKDNSDERFCTVSTPFPNCPVEVADWFRCRITERCIPSEWKCDGQQDCPDGSDEIACGDTISSVAGVSSTRNTMIGRFQATRNNSRSIVKWGPELPRIVVALFLTDPQFFAPGNATGAELAYELSLQVMAKLALKKKITTQELSLYINALTASCIDPKDFFGLNLVAELRNRVNNGNYTNPFSYLTLCNAGDSMTASDVLKVVTEFSARRRPLWTDVQALATMAMACMSAQSNSLVKETILTDMVEELKAKQHKNGTVDNARTTALVMQALIATDSYPVDFDFAGAVKYLVREADSNPMSVQDMYYTLPVFQSASLVNVTSKHCPSPIKTDMEVLKTLRESLDERVSVRVSMFLGNDVDFVRTWQLKVPANYNFYQVLENIGILEPSYKVNYITGQDKKPYIVGMHKYFDDAENEMFWFIFSQKLRNSTRPTIVENSPVDIQLKEDEELILWYRSGAWVDMPTK